MLVGTAKKEYNLYLTSDNGDISLVSNQCSTCNVHDKYDVTTGSGTLVTSVTPNTFSELCAISLGNDFSVSTITSFLANDEINM